MRIFKKFGIIVLICLQMGFVSHVYHAGYVEGHRKRVTEQGCQPCKDAGGFGSKRHLFDRHTLLKSALGVLGRFSQRRGLGERAPNPDDLVKSATREPTQAGSVGSAPRNSKQSTLLRGGTTGEGIAANFSASGGAAFTFVGLGVMQQNRTVPMEVAGFRAGAGGEAGYWREPEERIGFLGMPVAGPVDQHASLLLAARQAREKEVVKARDFRKNPVVLYRSEAKSLDCDVGCTELPSAGGHSDLVDMPTSDGKRGLKIDKYSMARTMESGANFPDFKYEALAQLKHVDVISTTSLRSHVPAVYGAWHLFNITEELDLRPQPRQNAAVAFVSNCASELRLKAMKRFRELGVQVHNYGNCERTHTETAGGKSQASKTEVLRRYKFCFAFENSQEEDYTTEKLWQCIAHGGLPVVLGPPNAWDYAPAGRDSMLYVPNLEAVPEVAKRMEYLMQNEHEYRKALSWKQQGPSGSFLALLDIDNVHGTCRSCIHAADRLTREFQQTASRTTGAQGGWGVCAVYDAASNRTTYLVDVRERGTFYFRAVLLADNQLTVQGLHEAIREKFEKDEVKPTFLKIRRNLRPDWLGKDGHLHIYRVYPWHASQREGLFEDKGLTTDAKVRSAVQRLGAGKQCPRLEAVLI